MTLLASCTSKELLDENLPIDDLLYRLFHEDGVRVFKGQTLQARNAAAPASAWDRCCAPCPAASWPELETEGALEVTCEFCNSRYRFTLAELDTPEPG